MKYPNLLLLPLFISLLFFSLNAQSNPGSGPQPAVSQEIKSSPAYAEVVFRIAVLKVELEELLNRYTREYSGVKEIEYELTELENIMKRIKGFKAAETQKLTLALGKMFLQKAAYITEFKVLLEKYSEKHPEVIRARRRMEIFEEAIGKIL